MTGPGSPGPAIDPAGPPEPMRWQDIERVVELEAQLFAGDSPWSAGMFWSEVALTAPAARLEPGRGDERLYLVVREPGGRVAGYAGLGLGDELAEVMTIGVDPAVHRSGIGRRLLAALVSAAGPRRILLDVRTDNEAALALYREFGFVRIGVRRRYYQPSGADAYTMERPADAHAAGGQNRPR